MRYYNCQIADYHILCQSAYRSNIHLIIRILKNRDFHNLFSNNTFLYEYEQFKKKDYERNYFTEARME
jgi:hypothetical protein